MADDRQKIDEQLELLRQMMKNSNETQKCISEIDKKVDLGFQKMEYEIKGIKDLDERQNQILKQHAARSDALQKDNELREQVIRAELQVHDKRIEVLEQPRKWRKMTTKGLIWAGSIALALGAILKLLAVL
jgi:hypothetical protein